MTDKTKHYIDEVHPAEHTNPGFVTECERLKQQLAEAQANTRRQAKNLEAEIHRLQDEQNETEKQNTDYYIEVVALKRQLAGAQARIDELEKALGIKQMAYGVIAKGEKSSTQ